MANPPAKDEHQQLEALLGSGIKIPPQPRVLLEIDELLQQDDFSLKDLAKVIGKDVGLTAAVFRIANSPGMGSSQRIDSLDQAIAMLGSGPLVNMVKCSVLRQSLFSAARCSIGLALIVAYLVEGSNFADEGLGAIGRRAAANNAADPLWATIFCTALLGTLGLLGIAALERVALRWHVSQRRLLP